MNYALAAISQGADGGAGGGGDIGGWNQGIAGPISVGFQTTAETTAINLGSTYWAEVFRWFKIGTTSADVARHMHHRGRSSPATREQVMQTAASWMRSQGIINFTPHYSDAWVVSPRKNVYWPCGGDDEWCGQPSDAVKRVGGTTNTRTGYVEIYRGGVTRGSNAQWEAGSQGGRPHDIYGWQLTAIERAIFTIGHENWHYTYRIPPDENVKFEAYANEWGWQAVLKYRAWRYKVDPR